MKSNLLLPRVVDERYELRRKLGQGAMGAVFRAIDKQLKREVALKVTLPQRLADKELRRRFKREVQLLGQISHPNVVPIFDYYEGQRGESQVYTMEFVGGRALTDLWQEGPLATAKACEIARQLADGLAHVHELGIVHRDIKSDNVVITSEGVPRLIDFGLSRPSTSSEYTALTQEGVLVGTMVYMPPEVFVNADIDTSCDVYQLALILYELVTGTQPLLEASVADIVNGKAVATLPKASQVIKLKGAFRRLDAFIGRALGERALRPSAREFSDFLESVLAAHGAKRAQRDLTGLVKSLEEPKPRSTESSAPPEPKGMTRSKLALLFFFLLLVGTAFFYGHSGTKETNPLQVFINRGAKLGRDDGKSNWQDYAKLLTDLSNNRQGHAYQRNETFSFLRHTFGKKSPAGLSLAALSVEGEGKLRQARDLWLEALKSQLTVAEGCKEFALPLLDRSYWLLWRYLSCGGRVLRDDYELLDRCSSLLFQVKGSEVTATDLGAHRATLILAWALAAIQEGRSSDLDDFRPTLSYLWTEKGTPQHLQQMMEGLALTIKAEVTAAGWPSIKIDLSHKRACEEWQSEAARLLKVAEAEGEQVQHIFRNMEDLLRWRQMRQKLVEEQYVNSSRRAAWFFWAANGYFSRDIYFTRESFYIWAFIHRQQNLENALPGAKELFGKRWGRPFHINRLIRRSCLPIHNILQRLASAEDLVERVVCEAYSIDVLERSVWTSSHDFARYISYTDDWVSSAPLKETITEAFYRGRRAMASGNPTLALKHFEIMWQRVVDMEKKVVVEVKEPLRRKEALKELGQCLCYHHNRFEAIRLSGGGEKRLAACKEVLDYLDGGKRFYNGCLFFRNFTILHLVDSGQRYNDPFIISRTKALLHTLMKTATGEQRTMAFELIAGKPLPPEGSTSRRQEPMKN